MILRTRDIIEQIRQGEIPKGYIRTVSGISPTDWKPYTFGDIYTERKEPGSEELPLLMVSIHSGVSDGEVDEEELPKKVKRIEDKSQYKKAVSGDLVFNMMRAWQGAIGTVRTTGMVSPAYIVAKPNDKVYPLFMDYYTRTPQMINQINRQSYGVTDFRKRLYWDSFAPIGCILPPIEEQRKIVAILTIQDKVIELKEKRLVEKQRQKKYLMQQLLTGKKRLPGFIKSWTTVELGEIFNYIQPTAYLVKTTDYDDSYKTPVLTAGKTFILGYTNETEGVFTKVPVVIFDDFTTATKYVDFPFKVKSSAMKILTIKDGFSIVFAYEAMQLIKFTVGGHERHWISKYSCLTIDIPDMEEQIAIAEVLSAADREIELLRQDIEQEKQKKKALMQLLLTGIVRVEV
jgi:type I restriction enzyme S subunit